MIKDRFRQFGCVGFAALTALALHWLIWLRLILRYSGYPPASAWIMVFLLACIFLLVRRILIQYRPYVLVLVLCALGHVIAIMSILATELLVDQNWSGWIETMRHYGALHAVGVFMVSTAAFGGWIVAPAMLGLIVKCSNQSPT
jgi:glucan phosphoethanolaminetransferase (alkaline phosphatase superfamily)